MKFVRSVLVFLILFFVTASILTVVCSFVLLRYSGSRIDDEVIDAVHSCKDTVFYYFDSAKRHNNVYESKEIEGASLGGEVKYEYVTYDKIPEDLKNAFIAIEDRRFLDHNGIDYRRTISAVMNYMIRHKATFGGSTITQQLVKNLTGNDKKNIERKLSEAFCAMSLEREHDKSEIMEMYLNIINLSGGCRGVGAAARYYFSKSVDELSLCEAASIAAITNNPSKYDPQRNPNNNKKRRLLVLKCMLELGYVSNEQYHKAANEDLDLNIEKTRSKKINSWYVDTVIEDVIDDYSEKYGISRQNASVLLYKGGYRIYTAMDPQIQEIMETYFEDITNFPKDEAGKCPEASMIIIDPSSGDILGIAGNVGKKTANRVQNYATSTKRPPGSAIKPLSVYAPAIDLGIINWATVIEDSPVSGDIGEGTAWPSNANKKYIGDVTVKYAVSNSLNTVPVKILKMLGNYETFDFLSSKLRIESLDKKADTGEASLALGQPSRGITLRELTAAYSIFQNGIMCKSRTYYKVTDSNGRVILDNEPEQEKVISNETASIITKLLQNVVSEGTASGYVSLADSVEVAGKTGTTQYGYDKYFVGYTQDLLAGVWHGYEYPKTIECFKGNYSICIWDDIMRSIYAVTEYRDGSKKFSVSNNVREFSYDRCTGHTVTGTEISEEIEKGWFSIKDKKICNN